MFYNDRIKSLETSLEFERQERRRMLDKIYLLEGDLARLLDFLGASFVNVNKRVIEKKGGPEKG